MRVQRDVIALLCNVDGSAGGLVLGDLRVRPWPYEKLLRHLARIENVPAWTVETSLDVENGLLRPNDTVVTAEGHVDWPEHDSGLSDEEMQADWDYEHRYFREVEDRVKRLRLYADGHPALRATYVFKRVGRRLELCQSRPSTSGR
jgi:hypothetical protein